MSPTSSFFNFLFSYKRLLGSYLHVYPNYKTRLTLPTLWRKSSNDEGKRHKKKSTTTKPYCCDYWYQYTHASNFITVMYMKQEALEDVISKVLHGSTFKSSWDWQDTPEEEDAQGRLFGSFCHWFSIHVVQSSVFIEQKMENYLCTMVDRANTYKRVKALVSA